jgi:hypothetical protein
MSTLLYPPSGGTEPVLAHATQVDAMKNKGWLETAPKPGKQAKPTKEVIQDGES